MPAPAVPAALLPNIKMAAMVAMAANTTQRRASALAVAARAACHTRRQDTTAAAAVRVAAMAEEVAPALRWSAVQLPAALVHRD